MKLGIFVAVLLFSISLPATAGKNGLSFLNFFLGKKKTAPEELTRKNNPIVLSESSSENSSLIPKKPFLRKTAFSKTPPYNAQKSKSQLTKQFNNKLNDLKSICHSKSDQPEEQFKEKWNSLKSFLKIHLKIHPPYDLKLTFGDILHLMEDVENDPDFPTDLDVFITSYHRLYNLSLSDDEDEEHKSDKKSKIYKESEYYPDTWAKTMSEALECILKKL